MVAIAIIPIIVCIIGLLMYVLASNPKVSRIGEIMFQVGLFFSVWALAGNTVKL